MSAQETVPPAFRAFGVGAVKPLGWLRDQLRAQAEGLTGNLTRFWDEDSWWRGGAGENMLGQLPARGHATPDLLNGLVPLAWQLDDAGLQAEAMPFIEHALMSAREDGRFGPPQTEEEPYRSVVDLGRSKLMEALISYHDATGDERVPKLIENYFAGYLATYTSRSGPAGWMCDTAHQENLIAGLWLYERTRDDALLPVLVEMCHLSTPQARWAESFRDGWVAVEQGYAIAHGLKYPGFRYLLEGDRADVDGVYKALALLEQEFGQVGGRYAAHEWLPPRGEGRRPTHGTELCDVVEQMYSLEKLFEIIGDPGFGDRLEALAFNSLPGACTGDFWAHQYDQQANQVLVTTAQREFDNGPDANLYGLMPNYICCTGNLHHGWPRLVQHMWMGTHDGGIVALAYGPCEVTFRASDGTVVKVREETEYPFDGTITLTVDAPRPVSFPLVLRIPRWLSSWARARIDYRGGTVEIAAGALHRIHETWDPDERITLEFPMVTVPEPRSEATVAFRRGPLYLALRIDAEYKELAHYYKGSRDWEIRPTSAWNVTPAIHPHHQWAHGEVTRHPLAHLPFAGRGEPIYDAVSDTCKPWPHDEPLIVKMSGKLTANWGMHPLWPSAADPPAAPEVTGDTTEIELVPYGTTRIRVAEFPRADRVKQS